MSSAHKWLKSTETIAFDVTDRVARITLNRPEKRNALSGRMLREIHEALLEADDRIDVNVILLRGEGRDFCAGYDLTDSYGGKDAGKPDHDPAFYRTRTVPSMTTSAAGAAAGTTLVMLTCTSRSSPKSRAIVLPEAQTSPFHATSCSPPTTPRSAFPRRGPMARRQPICGSIIAGRNGPSGCCSAEIRSAASTRRGSGWRWKPIPPTRSMMRRMN